MQTLNSKLVPVTKRPIKVAQFGEGNFLRGFADYFIDWGNEAGLCDAGIAVIKPISFGNFDLFAKQDNIYTVLLRGSENGAPIEKKRVVTSIQATVDPFADYSAYLALAKSPDLRFVISNTTEAGIVFNAGDKMADCPNVTFPGKLTVFLFERFKEYKGDPAKGLIMIPCELIDYNGRNLKECVEKYTELWQLGAEFTAWVKDACIFASTLVDRIVTGYPRDEAAAICERLGYEDNLIVTGEPFAFWVIESDKDFSAELPIHKLPGAEVLFTDDVTPFKERKVRILNGAHTSMVPAAYLSGKDFVLDCVGDDVIKAFLNKTIFEEIIPTLSLDKEMLKGYAGAVTDRFANPHIKHALLAIALNSTAKWRARILPSLKGYVKNFGKLPANITFSFAALAAFYNGVKNEKGELVCMRGNEEYKIFDDAHAIDFFAQNCKLPAAELIAKLASDAEIWGEDLTKIEGFAAEATKYLELIRKDAKAAIAAMK